MPTLSDQEGREALRRFGDQGRCGNPDAVPPEPCTIFVDGPVCPTDQQGNEGVTPNDDIIGDERPDDWHIHTPADRDRGSQAGKAHSGINSLHYGRHLLGVDPADPPNLPGDTYRVNRQIAFVSRDINFDVSGTFELDFWHIVEVDTNKMFPGAYIELQSDDRVAVQVRSDSNFDPAISEFGPWERVEAVLNPYDGTQDTDYVGSATFDPGDDINPADPFNPLTTMCFPLFSYVQQGSAQGSDALNCTDTGGVGAGFSDCGRAEGATNPSRRGPGFTENGETGVGVWVHTKFNLARYAGRHVQIRWIVTTIDDIDAFFISYLEPNDIALDVDLEADDGWYIDDIQVTGTVATEISLAIDQHGTCAGTGDPCLADVTCDLANPGDVCVPAVPIDGAGFIGCPTDVAGICDPAGVVAAVSAEPAASVAPGSMVLLRGAASQMPVCREGIPLYRWTDGSTVLQEFSSDPDIAVSPSVTSTYGLEVACSQDFTCSDLANITVPVYSGVNAGMFVTAERSPASIQMMWLTPTLPASLTPDVTPPEFCTFRGGFDSTTRIDADFSDVTCLGCQAGVDAGMENISIDSTDPGPGTGLYYLISIDTRQGLSLGSGTDGPRTTTEVCP